MTDNRIKGLVEFETAVLESVQVCCFKVDARKTVN